MLSQPTSTRVVSLLRTDYLEEFLFGPYEGWQRFDGSHSELFSRMQAGYTVILGRSDPNPWLQVVNNVETAFVDGVYTVDNAREPMVIPHRIRAHPTGDDWRILALFRPVPQQ